MVSKTQDEQDRLKGEQKSPSSLEARLNRIAHLSVRLRYLGSIAFILTAMNLLCLITAFVSRPAFLGSPFAMSIFAVILFGLIFIVILAFELERKQGDTLFEEISDEV